MPCRSCRSGACRKAELCGVAFNQTKYKKPRVRGKGTGAGLLSFPGTGLLGGQPFQKLGRKQNGNCKQKSQPCGILPAQLRFWAIPHNLSADTASEVRQMPSKSADNTGCLIEHFGNADAVPQLPERCFAARRELCGVAFNQTKYKKPRVRGKGTGAGLLSFPRHGAFWGSAFFKKLGRRNKTEIAKQKSQPCGILPAQLRFWAIPHNSKCRYGERGAADAKPKAQIILDVLSSILATQMPCRSCRSGA